MDDYIIMKKHYLLAIVGASFFSFNATADICDTYYANMDDFIYMIKKTDDSPEFGNTMKQLFDTSKKQINAMPAGQNRLNACAQRNGKVVDQMGAWRITYNYKGPLPSSKGIKTGQTGNQTGGVAGQINEVADTVNQVNDTVNTFKNLFK